MRVILSIALISIALTPALRSQENCSGPDYGRFCLSIRWSEEITLLLYQTPTKGVKHFAKYHVFDLMTGPNSGIAGVSTITYTDTNRALPGKAVFELLHGATFGIAGLAYSPDSQWVCISLEQGNAKDPAIAWVNIKQAEETGVSIQDWSTFFLSLSSLYFRCDSTIQFYSEPSSHTLLNLELTRPENTGQYDYSLEPLRILGEWMQARLYIPSRFLQDKETAEKRGPPLTVWVKYLNHEGRPALWYMWE